VTSAERLMLGVGQEQRLSFPAALRLDKRPADRINYRHAFRTKPPPRSPLSFITS
jgi:hypothetical protein